MSTSFDFDQLSLKFLINQLIDTQAPPQIANTLYFLNRIISWRWKTRSDILKIAIMIDQASELPFLRGCCL